MREIHGIEVRALTRKEVKSLKQFGFYLSFYNPGELKPDQIDEGMDQVLELILPQDVADRIDDMPNRQVNEIFLEIIKETYGVKSEEKNLPESGNGSQTKSE